MRLWSLHPKYLDAKGLTALWREGLLAQKVLMGLTKGYRNHPQLTRFAQHSNSCAAIATYLHYVHKEARTRGYCFDEGKIRVQRSHERIPVTRGQILFERNHLLEKLRERDADRFRQLLEIEEPRPHPFFYIVGGEPEYWEKGRSRSNRNSYG